MTRRLRLIAAVALARVLDWLFPSRVAARQFEELLGIAEEFKNQRDWLLGVVHEGRALYTRALAETEER